MLQNLQELKAFIQSKYPMFLTNDLTLYSIVGKMVEYINNLIVRSNELNKLLKKLEDLTEEELKGLNARVDNFILETNRQFEEFKTEINTDLAKFKKDVTDNYNTFTQSQLDRLDVIIEQLTSEFDKFKTSIVTSYNDYISSIRQQLDAFIQDKENAYTQDKEEQQQLFETKYSELERQMNNALQGFITGTQRDFENFKQVIQGQLDEKNTEVQNALNEIEQNIDSIIEQKVNEYLVSEDFKTYLRTLYPVYVTLTYYGDSIPDLEKTDGYVYDTTNNALYLCEQSDSISAFQSYREIDMNTEMQNVLFTYNGYVYAITDGKLVDVRLGNA